MKILLIDPPINCFTGLIKRGYPIGLCMLASVANHENIAKVKVYDVDKSACSSGGINFMNQRQNMANFLDSVNNMEHPIWKNIDNILESFQPDLVGITSMTIQYASALQTARKVKEWNQCCTVIMGGPHASVMPLGMVEWPYTDIVVKGEGEEAFLEIIKKLKAGDKNVGSIPGVITKDDLSDLNTAPLEIGNLDALPFPDRNALENLRNYSPEDMGLILTSRGCPYECSYCSNFTRKTRFRSVDNILAEIVQVQEKFGTKQFMFKDDSFTLRRKRVENFCNEIISKKIKILWESTTRLDLVDDRLVKLMKRAGCNRIGVGVESGDEEMLKIYNKRLTKDQIRNGTNILTINNIFWTGYFMMGLPMERKEQMYKTLEFMKELAPPYAAIGIYKPYPGTKLFEISEGLGLVNSDVTNEHFFCTNPVDYFLKDPHHRCAHILEDELDKITSRIEKEFERSNKKLPNVFRRALSRQKLYLGDPKSFLIDLKRAIKWLMS